MASRRMFSARVTESTRFIKMPATSQNLYFHLGMNADDDGVVEAYPVMCMIGATEDDLKILVGKQFATVLNEDYVTFLKKSNQKTFIAKGILKDSPFFVVSPVLFIILSAKTEESNDSRRKLRDTLYEQNWWRRLDQTPCVWVEHPTFNVFL